MLHFRIEKILLFSRLEPQWGTIILSLLVFFLLLFMEYPGYKVSRPPYKWKIAVIKVNTIAKVTVLRKLQIEDLIHGSEIKNNTLQINPVGYY